LFHLWQCHHCHHDFVVFWEKREPWQLVRVNDETEGLLSVKYEEGKEFDKPENLSFQMKKSQLLRLQQLFMKIENNYSYYICMFWPSCLIEVFSGRYTSQIISNVWMLWQYTPLSLITHAGNYGPSFTWNFKLTNLIIGTFILRISYEWKLHHNFTINVKKIHKEKKSKILDSWETLKSHQRSR